MAAVALAPRPAGYVYKDVRHLLDQAATLAGEAAGAVAESIGQHAFNAGPEPVGKTGVGHLIEIYLGRKPNNSPEPDFPEFGVEAKALPLKRRGTELVVKEPTSLAMIDYAALDREPWPEAHVQRKLRRILWFPYDHHPDDKRRSTFRRPFLWSPEAADLPVFEKDYEGVRQLVHEGKAHEISEALSLVLSARRKGSRGQMAKQPHSATPAKSRAWALKTSYTGFLVSRFILRAPTVSLVTALGDIRSLEDVQGYVEGRLHRHVGKRLDALASETGAVVSGGKAGPAAFVRGLLGVEGKGQIEEFQKLGVRIHTLSVDAATGGLWEAVSFPAMSLQEFAEEEWEDAEVRDHVDSILFVPLLGESRHDRAARRLGSAFFWRPSPAEWEEMHQEWSMFQREVRAGRAAYVERAGSSRRQSGLTPASKTRILHVRPHGQDSSDTDRDPNGNVVTKQSFWLNKGFVEGLLRAARLRDDKSRAR